MMRPGRALDPSIVPKLQTALRHRGPDSAGRYVTETVALVSTRLAIVDIEHGDQPLFGRSGEVLVANGEIYNAPELREALPEYPTKTLSDCEPMLALYERDGWSFAGALRGMFAAALYDPNSGRLVLTRDGFGIKPLYYVETEELFAFASEPQAFFHAGIVEPEMRDNTRAELLQLKYTTGRGTIFEGVNRVLPGETLMIEAGRIAAKQQRLPVSPGRRQRRPYWSAVKAFDEVMQESVAVHLRGDVPCCLFLSGGVDSSILLALMQRVGGGNTVALSVGYEGDEDADESGRAAEIASIMGARFERVVMGPQQFWAHAPKIVGALDDPTTDAAVLPTYVLGRGAADAGFKVALCGEGADEMFGGYSRYRRAMLPSFREGVRRRRGVFDRPRAARAALHGWDQQLNAIERHHRIQHESRVQTLQVIDCLERVPNGLLIKLDRCLMANGVEGRTPFLDPKVMQFAFSLPDEQKVTLRYGKVLLRDWLARWVPEAHPYARKRGFNPPVGRWMAAHRSVLTELVGAHPAVRKLFSRDVVGRIFASAQEQAQPAWTLLFYALWHAVQIQQISPDGDVADVLSAARC